MASRGSETLQHVLLKKAACFWAQKEGYVACGAEVSLPSCNYRADIAAYRAKWRHEPVQDPITKSHRLVRQNVIGHTAVFECKQARADFLKDSQSVRKTLEVLETLHEKRTTLERALMVHFPSLRNGDSLFPEFESASLDHVQHETYQKTVRQIQTHQKRVFEKTKFEKMRRWSCANLFYLVVPEGLVAAHEVPPGWGLLVLPRDEILRAEELGVSPKPVVSVIQNDEGKAVEHQEYPLPPLLKLERKPAWGECRESVRIDLLQRIAAAGTRELNRQWALNFDQIQQARRAGL